MATVPHLVTHRRSEGCDTYPITPKEIKPLVVFGFSRSATVQKRKAACEAAPNERKVTLSEARTLMSQKDCTEMIA